jgi:hypothetical protein
MTLVTVPTSLEQEVRQLSPTPTVSRKLEYRSFSFGVCLCLRILQLI